MRKGFGAIWRRLGRMEKAFLVFAAIYALLYFTAPRAHHSIAGGAAWPSSSGCWRCSRLARRGMRKAIWRLRNRLIAAYLFIAVVPIVLILRWRESPPTR